MVLVDANILIHACNRDAPAHEPCRAWLDALRRGPDAWFLSWGVVYEFLRVITHPRVLVRPWTVGEAWRFVRALLAAPAVEVLVETDRHEEVVSEVLGAMPQVAGNILHDTHTAILMREHGVRRIATKDADRHRFEFLDPFDPVP